MLLLCPMLRYVGQKREINPTLSHLDLCRTYLVDNHGSGGEWDRIEYTRSRQDAGNGCKSRGWRGNEREKESRINSEKEGQRVKFLFGRGRRQ
jgi:hypothetical protein